MAHDPKLSLRCALLLSCSITFGATMAWVIGWGRPFELVLAWAVNVSAWSMLWWACEAALRFETARRSRVPQLLYYLLVCFSAGLVFAHTWFFHAAIERRLTVFNLTLPGVLTFFTEVLPPAGVRALSLLIVGTALLSWAWRRGLREPSFGRASLLVAMLVALTVSAASRAERIASPLFDSGQELWQLLSAPKLNASHKPASLSFAMLDKSASGPNQLHTNYKKVIVLVMETMTSRAFAEESETLTDATFLHRERARQHRFTRYFPNNQDSRTGMLDILSSRLIPHEAYADADYEHYRWLSGASSLVGRFERLGYATAFAVSQVELEAVVSDLPWTSRLHLSQAQIQSASRSQLCLTPDIYEQSCEDKALLPQVVDFVVQHERAFVFQEFIWGHAPEYNEASGKSNAQYYSEYVDALITQLSKQGVLDQTLIALTSDHGFRDKSLQSERWVYQIPLLFFASDFQGRDDARLLSHSDFKDLLFNELAPASTPIADNPFVMIVGPTGSGLLTLIPAQGELTLLKERAGMRILLSPQDRAPSDGRRDRLPASELLRLFDDYRVAFDRHAP